MSRTSIITVATGTLFAAAVVWTVTAQDKKPPPAEQERKVKEAEVPAAAMAALKKLAGSAPFTEFAEEIEHGSKFFEGSWKGPDGKVDCLVTEAGDLVELEESIPGDKASAAVRAAAEKEAGKDAKVSFERKTMILYEIHFRKDGKGREMIFTPDGRRFYEHAAEKPDAHAPDNGDDDDNDD